MEEAKWAQARSRKLAFKSADDKSVPGIEMGVCADEPAPEIEPACGAPPMTPPPNPGGSGIGGGSGSIGPPPAPGGRPGAPPRLRPPAPAHFAPSFWDHPKILGIFWDFLGLGWGHPNPIPKDPKRSQEFLDEIFHRKNSGIFWDGSQKIPKIPSFLGSFEMNPKKIGIIPKNWGHFGMVWGIYTRVRNSHTEARKNIYIRHRDGINVCMYCKCV